MPTKKIIILILLLSFVYLTQLIKGNGTVSFITLPCGIDGMRTINEALNTIAEGGIIQVLNGSWNEYVRVKKSVSLISLNQSRFGVIIDGKYLNYLDSPFQLYITASNVIVSGFTFRMTQIPPMGIGIRVENCRNIVIANCTFEDTISSGIQLSRVSNAVIFNNNISATEDSLTMCYCNNITVTYNTFREPDQNFAMKDCRNIVFHHNNLFKKPDSTHPGNNYPHLTNTTCTWDDGRYHGNYWSDYNGTDSNGDGIGDTPYQIEPNAVDGREHFDYYPLMTDPHLPQPRLLVRHPLHRRIELL